jgi:hypothetical protein
MAEVVGLFGDVPEPGKPAASCVNALRDLLERAEAGEIVGFAAAAVSGTGNALYMVGGIVGAYGMLGALDMAKADLVSFMRDMN